MKRNNKGQQNTEAPVKKSDASQERKRLSKKSIILSVIAIALILSVIAAVVVAIVSYVKGQTPIDFLNDNLSYYIDIDEKDYKDYTIQINMPKPGETELQHEIIKLLAKKKGSLLHDGKYTTEEPIDAGDKAYIWYTGYELDENGKRTDIPGSSNFWDTKPDEIVVGDSDLVVGFDLALIGKIPADYCKFHKHRMGKVQEGDVVYATVTYVEESGEYYENAEVRIDLGDEDVENKWGMNILDYLQEQSIGFLNSDTTTLYRADNEEAITYIDIQINFVTRDETAPLVFSVEFPYDYRDASLRNKTVYYDVYIDETLEYESAVYNDEFVTETLEIKAEELEGYEGEGAAEKYKSKLMTDLLAKYESNREQEIQNKLWKHLRESVKVKRLPKYEVRSLYDEYYYGYQAQYAGFVNYYDSLDAFICASLEIDSSANWKAVLTSMVEDEVKEKLIFYYILQNENMVPEGEEFDRIYRRELEADFTYYSGKTVDDYLTPGDYEKALSDYEAIIIEQYGKEGYLNSVYYNYAIGLLVDMAKVENIAEL